MKKLFAIILVAIMLCGCSANKGDGASSQPLTDYPATAFDITVKNCPQKVISLSPEVTDIIFALGSDAQLIGISKDCVSEKELARYGTSAMPDIEAIKAAKPDLVFVTDYAYADDIRLLSDAKIKVAQVKGAAEYIGLGNIYNNIAVLMSGEITGTRNAANTFKNIDGKIKSAANSNSKKVKAAIFVNDTVTLEKGCVSAELVKLAGINTLIGGSDSQIIKAKPDIILCPTGSSEAFTARFDGIKVKELDPSLLDRRGVKMVDVVTQIISVLEE